MGESAKIIPFPAKRQLAPSETPTPEKREKLVYAAPPFSRRFFALFFDATLLTLFIGFYTTLVLPQDWISDWTDPEVLKALFRGEISFTPPAISKWFALSCIAAGVLSAFSYFGFFEWRKRATLGKLLLGLRVTNRKGESPSFTQAFFRQVKVGWDRRSESEEQYLYLRESNFAPLFYQARATAVPTETAQAYLPFAYRHFILNEPGTSGAREDWDNVALAYVPGLTKDKFTTETRLRFFAELCATRLAAYQRLLSPPGEITDATSYPYVTGPAPIFRRIAAGLIDSVFFLGMHVPLYALALYLHIHWISDAIPMAVHPSLRELALNTASAMLTFPIIGLAFGWFYKTLGGSPGKILLGMRVFDSATGEYLSYPRAMVRIFLSLSFPLGFLTIVLTRKRKALHDILVHSQVIFRR